MLPAWLRGGAGVRRSPLKALVFCCCLLGVTFMLAFKGDSPSNNIYNEDFEEYSLDAIMVSSGL